jgi:PKD repeat protein
VKFTDLSRVKSPTRWNWSFGDGEVFSTTSASLKNTTHAYKTGVYSVNLTVTNASSSYVLIRSEYIAVTTAVPEIAFQPGISNISMGSTTNYLVTMDVAPYQLAGYNITVMLSNASVGRIVGVSYPSWVSMSTNSTLGTDQVWFKALDLTNTSGTRNITLLNLTIQGDAIGTTDLTVLPEYVDDRASGRYTVNTVPGQLTVSLMSGFPKPGGGYFSLPTDPDGDGKYEDLDGNGWIGFNDVVVLYNNMENANAGKYGPASYYDYDNSGFVGFNDIVRLYSMT